MAHTPGPWKPGEYSNRIIGADGTKVCDVAWSSKRPHDEQEANERLISAAPDLLAALQLVEKGLRSKHIKDQSLVRGEEVIALSSIVRNAIARATS